MGKSCPWHQDYPPTRANYTERLYGKKLSLESGSTTDEAPMRISKRCSCLGFCLATQRQCVYMNKKEVPTGRVALIAE